MKRKRTTKSTPSRKRAKTSGSAPVTRQEVQRLIQRNTELKYQNSITANTGLSTTATMYQITNIAQGTTDVTRVGDRLKLVKSYMRGVVYCGDVSNIVRFIIFQWFPNSTPVAVDILLPGSSGAYDWTSQYNHDLRQEFKVLYDKTWTLVGNGSAATAPYTSAYQACFQATLKPRHTELQYSGGGTTGTNQIWWMALSDSSAPTHPTIEFTFKTMYTDA